MLRRTKIMASVICRRCAQLYRATLARLPSRCRQIFFGLREAASKVCRFLAVTSGFRALFLFPLKLISIASATQFPAADPDKRKTGAAGKASVTPTEGGYPEERRSNLDRRQGNDRRSRPPPTCFVGVQYDTRTKMDRRKSSRRSEDMVELQNFKIKI